ncbi:MAG: PstS family phosphate ABC transporter substrate-binding protein [Solirubrobacterales bacterium]
MKRSSWLSAILICLTALAFVACGDDEESGSGDTGGGDSNLSGNIKIDGSSTVAPLSEAVAEKFQEENPDVKVTVGTSGTGGGFEKFCAGETDISDASREIKQEEIDACKKENIQQEQIAVANDGLAVAVNPNNPVTCVTTDQLNQIWDKGSKLKSWSEIDGLKEDFSADLELFGPGTDSGTFDFFTEAINGEEGQQRTDYNNVGEDDNQTVRGIEGAEGGMGYFGLSFIKENEGKVKALEVDGGDGCVAPSNETVQDGTYKPLGRELFIYPSDAALQKPEVKAFADYYVENAQTIAEEVLFVPLTDEQKTEAQDKVASLSEGSGTTTE